MAKMYDLGKKPTKLEPMGAEDKPSYPCLYDVNMDNYPPLGDMKMGDTGKAVIEFNIKPSGGIEIISMGPMDGADDKKDADKKTLLDRHKKDQGMQSASADEGDY